MNELGNFTGQFKFTINNFDSQTVDKLKVASKRFNDRLHPLVVLNFNNQ